MTGDREAAALLDHAARILVLTGAGISAESGVPTFRGPHGLWQSFRPEDLATPEAFARDPRLVWEWYGWRRTMVAQCQPNAGHRALAAWMLRRQGVTLVTQNVDTLHERAAVEVGGDRAASACPVRLHGSIAHSRCTGCGRRVEDTAPVDASSVDTLPRCVGCRGLLRPDVVWFGESLPEAALRLAIEASETADACLVVGTAGVVYPAAGFARAVARGGRALIVVDPGETVFDDLATVRLTGTAGEVLPGLLGVKGER